MGNMKFEAEPTPEAFRTLPIYERWAIARGMATTLNAILMHVEDYGDLERVMRVAIDYDVSLRTRQGHSMVAKLVLPAWVEKGLTWVEAASENLPTETWPDCQWYSNGSSEPDVTVHVSEFGEYLEFV